MCSVLSVVKKIMDLWLGHVLLILELSCVYDRPKFGSFHALKNQLLRLFVYNTGFHLLSAPNLEQ